MRSAADMSDSELLAAIAMPALIEQESGGRAGVLGPQTKYGRAQGMTQMLPATAQATARKIGMEWRPELMTSDTPEAADYQRTLGEAYLREGIETTGNLEDGFRYYHGGPNRKQWGPKTNAYAEQVAGRLGQGGEAEAPSAVSQMSDDELLAALGESQDRQPAVTVGVEGRPDLGVGVSYNPNKPPPKPAPRAVAQLPQRVSQVQGVAKGVLPVASKVEKLYPALSLPNLLLTATGLRDDVARFEDRIGLPQKLRLAPTSSGTVAQTAAESIARREAEGTRSGKLGEFAGNVLSTMMVPGGPAVGGALTGAALSEGDSRGDLLRDVVVGGAAGKVAGAAMSGLSKGVEKAFGKLPKIRTPAQLKEATDAAYEAARNTGAQYKPTTYDGLITSMIDDVKAARYNPRLHKNITGVMQELQKERGKSPSLADIDELRRFIRSNAIDGATKDEQRLGQMMIREIDNFLNTAGPKQVIAGDPKAAAAAIKEARALNTRFAKVDAITKALDEAGLRTSATGSGGNIDNATRQALLRTLKKVHNLTAEEEAALRKVIGGSPGQNTLRTVGKLSPQGSGLMTALGIGGTMANPIFGVPALVGAVSKSAADKMTANNVDDLLRLLSVGGSREAMKRAVPAPARVAQKALTKARVPASAGAAALAVGATSPKKKPK